MLRAENVTVRYGAQTVVNGLSFELRAGQWLMLVGPNGAGKSTLIEAIAQGVPYTGRIAGGAGYPRPQGGGAGAQRRFPRAEERGQLRLFGGGGRFAGALCACVGLPVRARRRGEACVECALDNGPA